MTGPAGRLGRADLHIHTLASDGTAGIEAVLDHVEHRTDLDVMAITDHERIDAALAGRSMARDRGLRAEVIIGEEVTTLGGHLLALFIDRSIRPYRPLRATILAVHDAGGLAIPAHPLVPYPLCAQGWMLRRLLDDPDPRAHPDGLETFNPTSLGKPWHRRVVRFADQHGLARLGNSDAHALDAIATGWTTVPGTTAADLRQAIESRATDHGGAFHGTAGQFGTFGQQLRKRSRDVRDEVAGRVRRDGTGRDHGYPGGRFRPPRFEAVKGADVGTVEVVATVELGGAVGDITTVVELGGAVGDVATGEGGRR
jgi:predicted metal-dependent phosphoesterase TrpH